MLRCVSSPPFHRLDSVELIAWFQATKENTGAKKRAQSQAASTEDITLEEGLLAAQEDLDEIDNQKGAVSIPLQEVTVSKEALTQVPETRQAETLPATPVVPAIWRGIQRFCRDKPSVLLELRLWQILAAFFFVDLLFLVGRMTDTHSWSQ